MLREKCREQRFFWFSLTLMVTGDSFGRGEIFITPRLDSPSAVLTVADLMIPSLPGWTAVTLPIGHCNGGVVSFSFIITMDPTFMQWLEFSGHLLRTMSWLRYSLCHLFQK